MSSCLKCDQCGKVENDGLMWLHVALAGLDVTTYTSWQIHLPLDFCSAACAAKYLAEKAACSNV